MINIRSEKISIIERLINIDDRELLKKIKNLLSRSAKPAPEPMDIDTFFSKIEEAEQAFEHGKTVSQNELRKEVKRWRKK